MTVLDRSDLEASPLADLHAIAGQLGLDGFRRLRKADLVEMIVERQGGGSAAESDEEPAPRTTRRRRTRRATEEDAETSTSEAAPEEPVKPRGRRSAAREKKGREEARETGRTAGKGRGEEKQGEEAQKKGEEGVVEGVVELQGNGSAFLRLAPPEASDGDVYVSAAQVRRCELADGDRVAGPVRTPRRSERYPSLVRIDTINGEPADEVAGRPKYDSLPAAFPSERFELGSEDPTLKAIEWLTPIGRGSRALIVGEAGAGKTETLRLLLGALSGAKDLEISLVLVGVRPEEVPEWAKGPHSPADALTLAASPDAQGQAVERAIEAGKRRAARGGSALVAIDSLDGLHPHVARRALAAARSIIDGGSLTVVATASHRFGGETTVITLDARRTSTGRLPALDLLSSATMRPELLVGEDSAAEIIRERAALAES